MYYFDKLRKKSNKTKSYQTLVWLFQLTGIMLVCALNPAQAVPSGAKYFPNVPLLNQDGKTLHFYDDVIKGKIVTINFMFTSCGDSCPLETAKLRKIQQLLGDHVGTNVHMYSISVDPDRDTPAVLKAYMKKFKVGPGWEFLTGKQEDIDLIRKKLGMYSDDDTELNDHAINFAMGNEATGQWVRRDPFAVPETLVAILLGRLQTHSLAALPSYEKTRMLGSAPTGEDLFITRCTVCHTIGGGDKIGPDLQNIVSLRDRKWLKRWLKEPDVMLKEQDPLAYGLYLKYGQVPMPNMRLAEDEIKDLIEYMKNSSKTLNTNTAVLNK